MWFDSHCHLDFPAFDSDRALVIARAAQASITGLFIPGVEPQQWSRLPVLRQKYGFPFGVGHHPGFLNPLKLAELRESLSSLSDTAAQLGASAIGETGLDKLVAKDGGATLELQTEAFVAHILVAKRLNLPLVLHVVRAHGNAVDLLEEYAPYPAGGVVHSYSGSADMVVRYERLGFLFGFGGALTRSSAKKAHAALEAVADERLLLETDAPDQTPSGFDVEIAQLAELAGPRNEPSALRVVAETVAKIRGSTAEHVLHITSENARRLFAPR